MPELTAKRAKGRTFCNRRSRGNNNRICVCVHATSSGGDTRGIAARIAPSVMGDSMGSHLLFKMCSRGRLKDCIREAQGMKVQGYRGTYRGEGVVQEVNGGR